MNANDARALAEARRAAGKRMMAARKGTGQKIWENIVGDDDPTTQNWGEMVGSALNKAGEALTLGLIGDEASAAVESVLPGVKYTDRRDHYRGQEEVLERDNPGLALGAEVAGALVAPVGALGAVGKGASMAKRMLASGAATGGMSGVYGYAEGEGGHESRRDSAISDAKSGAIVGAALPVVGSSVQRITKTVARSNAMRRAMKNAPTTDALRAQGQQAYQAVDDAGVMIKPEAFGGLVGDMRTGMRGAGLDELPGPGSLTPKSARVAEIAQQMNQEMASDPAAALPFSKLDQLRRHAGTAASNIDKADAKVGMQAIDAIDQFVERLGPQDLVEGDAKALQSAIVKARDTWARMSRSQKIDDAIEASQDYVSGEASGLRNQFKRILRNDKLRKGFNEDEIAVMRKAVTGGIGGNMLHLMGGGLGMITQMGAGAGLGGVPGMALAAGTSALSRGASNALARRQAEALRAFVAQRGAGASVPALPQYGGILEMVMRPSAAVTVE